MRTRPGFGASAFTKNGCEDGVVDQGIVTRSCSVTTTAPPTAAAKATTASERAHHLQAFTNQVRAQTGKALTAEQARILLELAEALA
jgi:hypothetical protein